MRYNPDSYLLYGTNKAPFPAYPIRPDRDVAITPRSMGTSSEIEQGQRKLLFDLK